jgi:hypothetical protein
LQDKKETEKPEQDKRAKAKSDAQKLTDIEKQALKDKNKAIEDIRKALIVTEDQERAETLRKIGEDYDNQIALAEKYYGEDSEKVLELRAARKVVLDEQQLTFDEQSKTRKN